MRGRRVALFRSQTAFELLRIETSTLILPNASQRGLMILKWRNKYRLLERD